jgi:adenylate kinase
VSDMNEKNEFKIYITGTPGTGKTTIAERLAKNLRVKFIEVNTLVIQEGLYIGYDINRDTLIIDDELLGKRMIEILQSNNRICISGGIVIPDLPFDQIIILHSSIPTLRDRLKERGYSKEKIESNIEAEIMNLLYYEMIEYYETDQIFEVTNDNQSIEETCEQIQSIIRKHHLGIL